MAERPQEPGPPRLHGLGGSSMTIWHAWVGKPHVGFMSATAHPARWLFVARTLNIMHELVSILFSQQTISFVEVP